MGSDLRLLWQSFQARAAAGPICGLENFLVLKSQNVYLQTDMRAPRSLSAIIRLRSELFRAIRSFFEKLGFTEVSTPQLTRSPNLDPNLYPFQVQSRISPANTRYWLITSPEHAMKRLLADKMTQIFQLTQAFRDDESSALHLPEFTILEWYRTGQTLGVIAEDLQQLLSVCRDRIIAAGGPSTPKLRLDSPWETLLVTDAIRRYAKFDPRFDDRLISQVKGIDSNFYANDFETAFYYLMVTKVEPHLGTETPTLLIDYPPSTAALARVELDSAGRPVAKRMELYINGIELANGFDELTDPTELRQRMLAWQQDKGLDLPLDDQLIEAVGRIPSPTAGIALGVDRLLMLLLGENDIRSVQPFAG